MLATQKIYCTILYILLNFVNNIGTSWFADVRLRNPAAPSTSLRSTPASLCRRYAFETVAPGTALSSSLRVPGRALLVRLRNSAAPSMLLRVCGLAGPGLAFYAIALPPMTFTFIPSIPTRPGAR